MHTFKCDRLYSPPRYGCDGLHLLPSNLKIAPVIFFSPPPFSKNSVLFKMDCTPPKNIWVPSLGMFLAPFLKTYNVVPTHSSYICSVHNKDCVVYKDRRNAENSKYIKNTRLILKYSFTRSQN